MAPAVARILRRCVANTSQFLGTISLIPANLKGQPQTHGGSLGLSVQLSRPGARLRDAIHHCDRLYSILRVDRVYLLTWAFPPWPRDPATSTCSPIFILRHTHQPVRIGVGKLDLPRRGHTSCVV